MRGKWICYDFLIIFSEPAHKKAAIFSLLCLLGITVTCEGCNKVAGNSRPVIKMEQQPNQDQEGNAVIRRVCDGSEVEFITREEWHARQPRHKSFIDGPVGMAFIHHTAGNVECYDEQSCIRQVQQVQNFHMDDRKWDDIGYSFIIGEDGRVYEGRGWRVVGAHTLHYNAVAYGVCVIGNFMEKVPNDKALTAVKAIIECGVQQGYINEGYEMFGHRDGRCTSCPGNQFYDLIKTWPHFSHRNITKYC